MKKVWKGWMDRNYYNKLVKIQRKWRDGETMELPDGRFDYQVWKTRGTRDDWPDEFWPPVKATIIIEVEE